MLVLQEFRGNLEKTAPRSGSLGSWSPPRETGEEEQPVSGDKLGAFPPPAHSTQNGITTRAGAQGKGAPTHLRHPPLRTPCPHSFPIYSLRSLQIPPKIPRNHFPAVPSPEPGPHCSARPCSDSFVMALPCLLPLPDPCSPQSRVILQK